MRNKIVLSAVSVILVLVATLIAACGGSGGGRGPTGTAGFVLRDGAVQTSDGRTVTSLIIDISRITARSRDTTQGDDDDADDHDDDDEHHSGDDQGDDDDQGEDEGDHDHGGQSVVVFDMDLDHGGTPRKIDLMTLTNSGVLLIMLDVPVGTYDRVTITLAGARAVFEDDPTQTPVELAIHGDDGADFRFDLQPPVVVSTGATSVAVIDFVPVITLHNGVYTLSHDVATDESGDCGDRDLDVEVHGTVGSVAGSHFVLEPYGLEVDLSQMDPVLLVAGMQVEVEGSFEDGVLVAHTFEIED